MLGMRTTEDFTATGVKEIADALGGGIREGSLLMLEGEAKSGKSILSQYITYGILSGSGSSVAYYTMGKGSETLLENMESMAIDVRHYYAGDRFRIYAMDRARDVRNPREYLGLIIDHIRALPENFRLAILDSVSPLLMRLKQIDKIDFMQACKECCDQGRHSILLTMDTHIFEGTTLGRVHIMSDYYLKLRTDNRILDGGHMDIRNVKVLDVTRMCGAERRGQPGLKFEVKEGAGIQILPLVQVRI